jgi:hypothetical protein
LVIFFDIWDEALVFNVVHKSWNPPPLMNLTTEGVFDALN